MKIDRGKIDRAGIDRAFGAKVFSLYANIDGVGSVYADLFVPVDLYAIIEGKGDVVATLQATMGMYATIDGTGSVYARLAVNTETITITFTGTLAAGKTVCIDGRDFTVLNDGVNAIADFSGDFPTIWPGANTVLYEDSEGSRTVLVAVTKKDRSI